MSGSRDGGVAVGARAARAGGPGRGGPAALLSAVSARIDAPASGAAIALATLLTVALYLWRGGASTFHPQLIAEDGAVFFTEAKLYGLPSIGLAFAGYLHLLPRLVAWLAAAAPSPRAPALYLAAATAIVAWSASTTASANHRGAVALAPLTTLVPGGGEIFATLTNVQWFLQPALVLVVASATPASRPARWNQLVFVALASLTGPFSIFLAPAAAWRIAKARDAHGRILGAIVIAGAVVQFGHAFPEVSPYAGERDPAHLALAMLDHWIGEASHVGRTLRASQWRDVAVLVAAVAIAAASAGRLAGWLLLYTVVELAATFVRFVPDSHYFDLFWSGERYFYMPRLALMWILALGVLRLRWSSLPALAGLVLMVSAQSEWRKAPYPRLPWAEPAAAIDRGEAVRIVTNPSAPGDTGPDVWSVVLPAREP